MPQNSNSFITEKECSRCSVMKPIAGFSKDRHHSSGYKSACKVCATQDWKKWRTENLQSARKNDRIYHYVRTYNLPEHQARALVEDRSGTCQICQQVSLLVVDHCHTGGEVRGLICSSCNSVLGYAKDNVKTLQAAIKYLETFYHAS